MEDLEEILNSMIDDLVWAFFEERAKSDGNTLLFVNPSYSQAVKTIVAPLVVQVAGLPDNERFALLCASLSTVVECGVNQTSISACQDCIREKLCKN